MSLPYKKIVIIGATSGIGLALAERFLACAADTHVIVTGRRRENLDAFVAKHTADRATGIPLDVTELDAIGSFAATVEASHLDVDFVLVNSGIQRGYNFADPGSVDLTLLDQEVKTNYVSHVHLAMAFLPQLQRTASSGKPAALAFTTSGLALVPSPRCGNYSATKAAMHAWTMVLREQLRPVSPGLKVIEILPPAVATELHDAKNQPGMNVSAVKEMPLDEFTEGAWKGLVAGKEMVAVGLPEGLFAEDQFEGMRQAMFSKMVSSGTFKLKD